MVLVLTFSLPHVKEILGEGEAPVVHTPLGKVTGFYSKSFEGRNISAFEGIPYAKPPVDDLRFKGPLPIEKWPEDLVATKSYVCMQYLPILAKGHVIGSEDCLYINVYTPVLDITGEENLDVVAYIHGGAFMLGSPKLLGGADFMMDQNVVYVNFNYRLGIMGFLSTEDDVVPGNNGLKDQLMALKWIRDNIRYFGGNPNSVTLAGSSAGAASVHYHYLSPLSKGLFHKGFSQSGTALLSWALSKKPLEKTRKLAYHLDCTRSSSLEMAKCLRNVPAHALVGKLPELMRLGSTVPFAIFGPVVEKGPGAFLPDHPYTLLKEGKVYDVPWVCSSTKDEGGFPTAFALGYIQELKDNWYKIMPYALDLADTVPHDLLNLTMQKITKKYITEGVSSFDYNHTEGMVRLFTDRTFLIDTEKTVRLQSSVSKAPVFYYYFTYKLEQPSIFSSKVEGVCHSDDTRLLFKLIGTPAHFPEGDRKLKDAFVDFLYTYASTSKLEFNGVKWDPVNSKSSENLTVMQIGGIDNVRQVEMKELTSSLDFWRSLPIMENEKVYSQEASHAGLLTASSGSVLSVGLLISYCMMLQ